MVLVDCHISSWIVNNVSCKHRNCSAYENSFSWVYIVGGYSHVFYIHCWKKSCFCCNSKDCHCFVFARTGHQIAIEIYSQVHAAVLTWSFFFKNLEYVWTHPICLGLYRTPLQLLHTAINRTLSPHVSKHPTITLKSTNTPIDGQMHLVYPQSNETRWVLQKPKKITKVSHSFIHLPSSRLSLINNNPSGSIKFTLKFAIWDITKKRQASCSAHLISSCGCAKYEALRKTTSQNSDIIRCCCCKDCCFSWLLLLALKIFKTAMN